MFPKSLSPSQLKEVIRISMKNGELDADGNIVYSGRKTDKFGIEKPVKIVWNSGNGVIRTAFVHDK